MSVKKFQFAFIQRATPSPRRDITGSEMLKFQDVLVKFQSQERTVDMKTMANYINDCLESFLESPGSSKQTLLCAKGSCVLNQTDGKVFPST